MTLQHAACSLTRCSLVCSRQLPIDGPYNGVLVLSDGNLISKNLGYQEGDVCRYSILEPDGLSVVSELELPIKSMGRFSADLCDEGEFIYTSTATHVKRLKYANRVLTEDAEWGATYHVPVEGEVQSDGWDTCIGSGSVWMMDAGRPPTWIGPSSAPQRAFRFSIDNPSDRDVVDHISKPFAFNPGPPLYDPERKILVHYDTINRTVVAHKYAGPGGGMGVLWKHDIRNTVQMMLYPDTGELVLEDSPKVLSVSNGKYFNGFAVVLDISTGQEKGRAPLNHKGTMGMFLCPGFERDFYVAAINGTIARVMIDDNAAGTCASKI